eukprot:TRINITY_DN4373_c0_g1_i8.p1 TRINITY_DN4373_c0_g1~~TRINITY_DN4373_c0_g1_i8.p1  ORF type:complete len:247 (-),score=36.73 TRINITY_DN4373_c0_g1_i8:3-743(-)
MEKILFKKELKEDSLDFKWNFFPSALAYIGCSLSMLGLTPCDPIAALILCGWTLKKVYSEFMTTRASLIDENVNHQIFEVISKPLNSLKEIMGYYNVRLRNFGLYQIVDLTVVVDGSLSLRASNSIAEMVKHTIKKAAPTVKDVTIELVPATDTPNSPFQRSKNIVKKVKSLMASTDIWHIYDVNCFYSYFYEGKHYLLFTAEVTPTFTQGKHLEKSIEMREFILNHLKKDIDDCYVNTKPFDRAY